MKINDLNPNRLAEVLVRAPLASFHAHHKKIQSTMKDYILPSEDQLEAQFVRDLFVLDTQEIIEKWYGGDESARDLIFRKNT